MQVLHGFYSPRLGVCLWAEDSRPAVKSPSQALRGARPHPFAAGSEELAGLAPGKPAEATLWLPSLRSAPLDSPEVVRVTPRPAPRTAPRLLAWTVPVISCEPLAAPGLLDEPMPDVRPGESLRFVAELVAFAWDLAGRGRVLPTVDRAAESATARWRPVLQGPDVVYHSALAAAMPPVCRAEAGRAGEADGADPHELVSGALSAMADAAVRERLTGVASPLPARRGRRPKRLPASEGWLAALTGGDGRFDAEPAELDELGAALAAWDEIGQRAAGAAHATFLLREAEPCHESEPEPGACSGVEPEPAAEPAWRLEFLLQSAEDPSLLVPAEQAWAGEAGLARWLADPQELLLAELGRATPVYPELSRALAESRPSGLDLDTDGAYHFLSAAAGELDQAGFGVLLPSWWDSRGGLGLKLTARQTPTEGVVTASGLSRETLVAFDWRLAIGDEALSEEEIAALARSKAPLVRLRGRWVAVDAEAVRRGLDFLASNSGEEHTAADVLTLAASHPDDTDLPLELTSVTAEGTLGELLEGAGEHAVTPVDPPAEFRAELRDYQRRGLSWLAFLARIGAGGCLADDMGLGKTIQLLALESLSRAEEPEAPPSLLLCPMSVVGNWVREAGRFAPGLRVHVQHGPRPHGADLDGVLACSDLVVTTYATATRDIDELAGHRWSRVVLDEAQAVKNSLSQGAKAVRRLPATQRFALTGTPMENRLSELFSIMDFANPGMLGSAESFRARYAIPVERHGNDRAAERLRKITRPYVLRREKTDPAIAPDLPEKIETREYCRLTAEQASLYQTVVSDMMERIEGSEGIERRGNVLAAMTKLKQVCNHPAQLLGDQSPVGRRSGKISRLEELCDEILADGEKVLCFTQFTAFAELLLPHLAARYGERVAYLHGGTPKKRRDELVEGFQAAGGPSIFLLSLKAGGTGLNLTAANHVIHIDRWWNPAVENQATDRAFRIGQRRGVGVHKFVTAGTLEERIDELIERKKALAEMVVSDGEAWLTELSSTDLRDLFTLSRDALDE